MAKRSEKEQPWLNAHSATAEDKYVAAHLLDQAHAAQHGANTFSCFLDPHQRVMAQSLTAVTGAKVRFDGGYDGAERAVAVFLPYDAPDANWRRQADYPLSLLHVRVAGGKNAPELSHRDYLGALMGLGVKREYVGDIVMAAHGADIFVLRSVAPYLCQQWESAGRASITVEAGSIASFAALPPETQTARGTVPSLRLDAVLSEAFGLSRAKILPYIESGRVSVAFVPCAKPAAAVREGDMLSVRGLGRVRLVRICGQTRKGRVAVEWEKFI